MRAQRSLEWSATLCTSGPLGQWGRRGGGGGHAEPRPTRRWRAKFNKGRHSRIVATQPAEPVRLPPALQNASPRRGHRHLWLRGASAGRSESAKHALYRANNVAAYVGCAVWAITAISRTIVAVVLAEIVVESAGLRNANACHGPCHRSDAGYAAGWTDGGTEQCWDGNRCDRHSAPMLGQTRST